jgi:hypothetical protein
MKTNKRPETKLAVKRQYTDEEKAWAENWFKNALRESDEKDLKTKKIEQIKEATKVKIPEKIADKKEKIVILVAIAIIIFMGIFPPWTYTFRSSGIYSEKPTGYRFLFWPPAPENARRSTYGIYLDYERLFLQWVMVVISTLGALLWLKIKNKQINNSKALLTKEEQKKITTGYLKNLAELGFQIKITPPKEFRRKNQLKKD